MKLDCFNFPAITRKSELEFSIMEEYIKLPNKFIKNEFQFHKYESCKD